MPTESAFLLAGLLFLAAGLGYVFARFGDDDEESHERLEYLRGLKYLLKEQPDRAVEVFTRAADPDEETLDTHFALGQLFRRRGEWDRAIRVHRDLIERANLTEAQRDQAKMALAGDYLSAGLFDRAESLFTELKEKVSHRAEALRQLVQLSELTREWDRAIELRRELDGMDRSTDAPGAVAHYHCEHAEQALREGNLRETDRQLHLAEKVCPGSARVWLTRARLASRTGDQQTAVRCYRRVAELAPALLVEVLPTLWALYRSTQEAGELSEFLRDLLRRDPAASRSIALAAIIEPEMDEPLALKCLWSFLVREPTLSTLMDGSLREAASDEQKHQVLKRVRGALHSMAMAGRRYSCRECGYASLSLQWQCPGCRAWDTVRPQVRLIFEAGDRG